MSIKRYFKILVLCSLVFTACHKKTEPEQETPINDEEIVSPPNSLFQTVVPKKLFDIVLLKPTTNSITLSVLGYKTIDATIAYGLHNSTLNNKINVRLAANTPQEILINNLLPATNYDYTLSYKVLSNNETGVTTKKTFCTAKNAGTSFSFAILADSHLDMQADTTNYKRTLYNIAEANNDFMIDLGDTFMNDKYGSDFSMALYNYLAQRYFLGSVSASIPYYFVQGNHDGELGFYNDGTAQCNARWSNTMRKKYFPMPVSNDFYKGNDQQDIYNGYLQDYYAWQWGDALFIVLDPFWYTMQNGSQEPWNRTLGLTQYNWLKSVLQNSTAHFKFVFIHHLVGGADLEGKARGGSEVAGLYEWGGNNTSGQNLFSQKRSGWEMPVHNLLKSYGVNVVFHGHDHFYAYQSYDGIIYQEVPQPGSPENIAPNQASTYGYQQGTIFGFTGYLQISVSSNTAKIEYIGTNTNNPSMNKRIIHSYIIN